jgi:hypothetical protein
MQVQLCSTDTEKISLNKEQQAIATFSRLFEAIDVLYSIYTSPNTGIKPQQDIRVETT